MNILQTFHALLLILLQISASYLQTSLECYRNSLQTSDELLTKLQKPSFLLNVWQNSFWISHILTNKSGLLFWSYSGDVPQIGAVVFALLLVRFNLCQLYGYSPLHRAVFETSYLRRVQQEQSNKERNKKILTKRPPPAFPLE